jgi:hypothetical protein
MSVSLTVDGTTFTFDDDEIDSVESETNQSPDQISITGTGAMGSYIYNYDGAKKTIRVTGHLKKSDSTRISGYSIDTIIEQKQWLESVFNGTNNKITFVSDYETTSPYNTTSITPPYKSSFAYTKVIGGSIRFIQNTFNIGNDNLLSFTMLLVVGN